MTDKGYSATSYLGAATAFFAGLTTEQRIALAGLLLGLGTFLINLWRQYRSDARERRQDALDAQIKMLKIRQLGGAVDCRVCGDE
ncbi:HP1 family phage holin [Pseudothauera nasutitermitis]|uniref:HP1 family phage holin n=1 Tax=Pseudothauera nasutitermitis TaxID=2565930 RepID=UPI001454DFB3|nr:HP1 family phage holin [Pseudothauera nasutitermitis]